MGIGTISHWCLQRIITHLWSLSYRLAGLRVGEIEHMSGCSLLERAKYCKGVSGVARWMIPLGFALALLALIYRYGYDIIHRKIDKMSSNRWLPHVLLFVLHGYVLIDI